MRGFFWFYFINEHVLRYLNPSRTTGLRHRTAWRSFWGLLVVWLMPWIAFLFRAIDPIRMRSSLRRVAQLPRHDQAWGLLGIWAAFVMLFFSFSTRQEYYALPALPPLAHDDRGLAGTGKRSSSGVRSVRAVSRAVALPCALFLLGATGSLVPRRTLLSVARPMLPRPEWTSPLYFRKIPESMRSRWGIFLT